MPEARKPTVKQAQMLSESLNAKAVIILAFWDEEFAGASYGETKAECRQIGRTMNVILDGITLQQIPVWE